MKEAEQMYETILPFIKKSDAEESERVLEDFVNIHPEYAKARNDLGSVLYKLKKKARALIHFEKAVGIEPDNCKYMKDHADFLYSEMGKPEEALEIYGNILKLLPEDVEILLISGHLSVSLNRFEDAKSYYERILLIEPWHMEATDFLDKLENRKTDGGQSLTSDAMYSKCQTLADNGNTQAAIKELERLVQQHPEFALAHNDLAVLNYNLGHKEKILAHYQEAARLDPGNTVFLKNLADFYFVETGDFEKSLEIYAKILSDDPEDIEALQIAGHICMAMEKYNDAKTFYHRILDIEPWNFDAGEYLEKIAKIESTGKTVEHKF